MKLLMFLMLLLLNSFRLLWNNFQNFIYGMAVAQWRQMRQMPHFWNGKCNLWKQIKSIFFFKICLNSTSLPHFIQTRPAAVYVMSFPHNFLFNIKEKTLQDSRKSFFVSICFNYTYFICQKRMIFFTKNRLYPNWLTET